MITKESILRFKQVNCVNCYKCVRYCPVKAVRIRNHQAHIIHDQCILCERCSMVCPQNAKVENNRTEDVKRMIAEGKQVILSLHPSYVLSYGAGSFRNLKAQLMELGFADVREASEAVPAMIQAYSRIMHDEPNKLYIASHCPVATQLVVRHYPSLAKNLIPVQSLMQIHASQLLDANPVARIVYAGPCIGDMINLFREETPCSCVITLKELKEWLLKEGKTVENTPIRAADTDVNRAISLPSWATFMLPPMENVECFAVDGLHNCRSILDELTQEARTGLFVELSACRNGCMGGPSFNEDQQLMKKTETVLEAAFQSGKWNPAELRKDDEVCMQIDSVPLYRQVYEPERTELNETVSEEDIRKALERLGKFSHKDELNCGACGYDTCREKAIATVLGKAEPSMCIPYMRARQENHANKIINAMPGLMVTVDYQLRIVQLNKATLDMFFPVKRKNVIGSPIGDVMDDYAIAEMISFDRTIMEDEIAVRDGQHWLERVLTNDRKDKLIICIMKDVTKERRTLKEQYRRQIEAVEIADALMEEQLEIVHRIAGYLGETAADTKIAIEKLKATIRGGEKNGR